MHVRLLLPLALFACDFRRDCNDGEPEFLLGDQVLRPGDNFIDFAYSGRGVFAAEVRAIDADGVVLGTQTNIEAICEETHWTKPALMLRIDADTEACEPITIEVDYVENLQAAKPRTRWSDAPEVSVYSEVRDWCP